MPAGAAWRHDLYHWHAARPRAIIRLQADAVRWRVKPPEWLVKTWRGMSRPVNEAKARERCEVCFAGYPHWAPLERKRRCFPSCGLADSFLLRPCRLGYPGPSGPLFFAPLAGSTSDGFHFLLTRTPMNPRHRDRYLIHCDCCARLCALRTVVRTACPAPSG